MSVQENVNNYDMTPLTFNRRLTLITRIQLGDI